MFTRPLHSKFFTLGQVIETFRGQGIFQPAVDRAVKLLQDGEWVGLLPFGILEWMCGEGRIDEVDSDTCLSRREGESANLAS